MNIPTAATILRLHQKYAPSERAFAIVYGHCQIIADIAEQLMSQRRLNLTLDSHFIHSAILLHDIGYYPLFDSTGYVPKSRLLEHGIVGAELLRAEGLPEAVSRIAERHTGMGLTKQHIIEHHLPLPPRDFIAETPEEWLIMYADKLHTKSIVAGQPPDTLGWFNAPETYMVHARGFGEENGLRFQSLIKQYGTPNLVKLSKKYGQEIR